MTEKIMAITEYYNERDNIESLVANMASQSMVPDLWLLIDDGSTDDSTDQFRDMLSEYPIPYQLVKMPPKESPDANRKGVAFQHVDMLNPTKGDEMGFDYLLKVDADTKMPERYIEFCVRLLERLPEVGVMAGRIRGEEGSETPMGTGKFVRREVARRTAGQYWDLDPDSLWNLKALSAGYELLVLEDVLVEVTRPTRMVSSLGQFNYGRRMYYLGWGLPEALIYAIVLFLKDYYPVAFLRGYIEEWTRGNWHCHNSLATHFYSMKRMLLRQAGLILSRDTGVCVSVDVDLSNPSSTESSTLDRIASRIRRKLKREE